MSYLSLGIFEELVLHEKLLKFGRIGCLHQTEHQKNARLLRAKLHRGDEAEFVIVNFHIARDYSAAGMARSYYCYAFLSCGGQGGDGGIGGVSIAYTSQDNPFYPLLNEEVNHLRAKVFVGINNFYARQISGGFPVHRKFALRRMSRGIFGKPFNLPDIHHPGAATIGAVKGI